MRPAFTLIEVIVALLLLEIGVLALLASTALIARDLGAAQRRVHAQWLARDRVAQLRLSACSSPSSGRSTSNDLEEFWRIDVVGDRRVISDSVTFALTHGRGHATSAASVLCSEATTVVDSTR